MVVLKSPLTWVSIWMCVCTTIAAPALQNLAGHVPDQIKSIVMFVSTLGSLYVTFKLSTSADTKELVHKIKSRFVLMVTIMTVLDAYVIYSGDVIWRYVFEQFNNKMLIPVFGIMYVELRQQEADRLGTDLSTWIRKLEFPKYLAIALAGVLTIWLYQPGKGLSLEEGLWLVWSGGAVADGIIAVSLLKRHD